METEQPNSDSFDERQSIQVIREMIEISKKKLYNDGILFIIWGWTMFNVNILGFIERKVVLTFQIQRILSLFGNIIGIFALGFSIYYILKHRKKVQTYIGISLRYIWFSMFVCMVLINLIQFNVLHKIHFELQYPIFMVIIAFAWGTKTQINYHWWSCIWINGVTFFLFYITKSTTHRSNCMDYCICYSWSYFVCKSQKLNMMFKDLDQVLHSQARLAIMSLLLGVKKAEFNFLLENINTTKGNLSFQLNKLNEVEYVKIVKSFKGKYPLTTCEITEKGIKAYENYVNTIDEYFKEFKNKQKQQ